MNTIVWNTKFQCHGVEDFRVLSHICSRNQYLASPPCFNNPRNFLARRGCEIVNPSTYRLSPSHGYGIHALAMTVACFHRYEAHNPTHCEPFSNARVLDSDSRYVYPYIRIIACRGSSWGCRRSKDSLHPRGNGKLLVYFVYNRNKCI